MSLNGDGDTRVPLEQSLFMVSLPTRACGRPNMVNSPEEVAFGSQLCSGIVRITTDVVGGLGSRKDHTSPKST